MSQVDVIIERLRQVAQTLNRFGGVRGSRVVIDLYRAGSPSENAPLSIRLPGYPAPLLVRRGASDRAVFRQVFVDGEYDFDGRGIEPRFIVDGGANVGYASVFFAKKFPQARIVAVEPELENYELLLANTANYPSISCERAAIWNTKTNVEISNPDTSSWGFRVEEGASATIPTVTIPEVMAKYGAERIDILKLDIEGAEKELFSSRNVDWLDRVSILVIELHDWLLPGCAAAFYHTLAGVDFMQAQCGENAVVYLPQAKATAV